MFFTLQNLPTTLPSNLLSTLTEKREVVRDNAILDLLHLIGALRRTGNEDALIMRELVRVRECDVNRSLNRFDAPLMETIIAGALNEVEEGASPENVVWIRERWECILWALYAYEEFRTDRVRFMGRREDFEKEIERLDVTYRPALKAIPVDRTWRRQQRKMLTETDRRDWWWYD